MERTLNRFITLVREKFVATCTRLDEMRNEDGLTLIELLAVVVILGIIATFAVPTVSGAITRSKLNTTLTTEGTIQQALERYDFDHGQYPTQLSQLTEQTDATGVKYASVDSTGPFGPYMNSVFPQNDGWGNPIYYAPLSNVATAALPSVGSSSPLIVGYVLISGDGSAVKFNVNGDSDPSSVTGFVYASGGMDYKNNSIGYAPTVSSSQLPATLSSDVNAVSSGSSSSTVYTTLPTFTSNN